MPADEDDRDPSERYRVEVAVQTERADIDAGLLRDAVRAVLQMERAAGAEISVAVVDDATMHELNRRHLDHDYPTDVLSFLLDSRETDGRLHVDGEVIVSWDTAACTAPEYGHPTVDELLLYVVHGTLHLLGYDDHSEADRERMRAGERAALQRLGVARGRRDPVAVETES